jgi:hypothetical protein
MHDFNRANISETPLSVAINALIEAAEPPEHSNRKYLGASAIGSECLRRVQYDWMCDPQHPTRTRDIFARGHYFEEISRQHLIRAGLSPGPNWPAWVSQLSGSTKPLAQRAGEPLSVLG